MSTPEEDRAAVIADALDAVKRAHDNHVASHQERALAAAAAYQAGASVITIAKHIGVQRHSVYRWLWELGYAKV